MRGARTILIPGLMFLLAGLVGPATSRAAGEVSSVSAEDAAEANILRKKAFAHFSKKEYAQAIELFQKALLLERKVGAMAQMAASLSASGRYDEALRWYETALEEFPNAKAATRDKVIRERDELLAKVGTIAVEGEIIQGARLFIDERDVGALPLEAPIRVLGGVHDVRAEKPGFTPILVRVEVTAGQAALAKLVAKQREAKIEIREKHNWVLHVEIDGNDVGLTPLSKIVSPGEHRIRLRGHMQPDALLLCETPEQSVDMGARMESEEKTVTLGLFEAQSVELSAEDMDASLHVDSTPPGAGLWIDGHDAGKTPWEGRLPLGEHAVEVRRPGFYTAKKQVILERRKPRDLVMTLEREPDLAADHRVARNAKIGVGLAYGVGGIGLGMFGVAGGLFLRDVKQLKANCPDNQCPSTEEGRLASVDTLGTVSTIGLVVGGLGVTAGTTLFFLMRPAERKHPIPPGIEVQVGWGRLGLEGRF